MAAASSRSAVVELMRFSFASLLLLSAVSACGRTRPSTPPSPLARDEEGVYRTVIDSVYLRVVDAPLAVISSTVDTVCAPTAEGACPPLARRFGVESFWWAEDDTVSAARMRADLLSQSAEQRDLSTALAGDPRVRRVPAHEIGEILSRTNGWPTFRDRYGGAPGFVRFSRVGFSDDGQRALVYVEWECGPTCGHRLSVSLRQSSAGDWLIRDQLLISSRRTDFGS